MDLEFVDFHLPFAWASLLWGSSEIAHLVCSFTGTALYARGLRLRIASYLKRSVMSPWKSKRERSRKMGTNHLLPSAFITRSRDLCSLSCRRISIVPLLALVCVESSLCKLLWSRGLGFSLNLSVLYKGLSIVAQLSILLSIIDRSSHVCCWSLLHVCVCVRVLGWR